MFFCLIFRDLEVYGKTGTEMRCIIINLERSIARREFVAKEFKSHGIEYEFFRAKDRFELSARDYEDFAEQESKATNWNHPSVPGVLACWISHHNVWKFCLENRLEMVAIFEDDVLLNEQFGNAIRNLESIKNSFDIVFLHKLYANQTFKPLIEVSDEFSLGLVRFQNIGLQGYVINRYAMQTLTACFPKFQDSPVDDILHSPWLTGLRTYTLNPAVVVHRVGHDSTIDIGGGGWCFSRLAID